MSEDGCRLRNQMLIIMHSTAGWNSFFIDSRDGGCGGCSNTTVTRAASGLMACAFLYSSRLFSSCCAECQLIIVKILNAEALYASKEVTTVMFDPYATSRIQLFIYF